MLGCGLCLEFQNQWKLRKLIIIIIIIITTTTTTTTIIIINKYIELADEIRRIWNQKEVKIIPLLVSATGIVPKNLFNSLKETGLPQSVYRITKASYLRDLSYCSEI
jgi:hypothetical protein